MAVNLQSSANWKGSPLCLEHPDLGRVRACSVPADGWPHGAVWDGIPKIRHALAGGRRLLQHYLPWSRFHTVAVAALGIKWILDGLKTHPDAGGRREHFGHLNRSYTLF